MIKLDLSIILPMYNEVAVIEQVLLSIISVLEQQLSHYSYEIVVVDDGSSDGSPEQVTKMDNRSIHLYQHPYNIGNGAAVKTGIRNANGEVVVLLDADGQHKPEDIPRLLEHIDRYDMVVGARVKESETAVHRDIANTIYNTFASYVCDRKIEDLTSGFRAIRTNIAKSLVHLLPNTFSYPTTITLAIVRSGYSLKYIPITTKKRVGKSKIKLLRDGSRFLMILFKITTLFSPLKIFFPASMLMFLLGAGYGGFKVFFLEARYGPTSAMLMTMSLIIFLMGLISEQITYLRYKE